MSLFWVVETRFSCCYWAFSTVSSSSIKIPFRAVVIFSRYSFLIILIFEFFVWVFVFIAVFFYLCFFIFQVTLRYFLVKLGFDLILRVFEFLCKVFLFPIESWAVLCIQLLCFSVTGNITAFYVTLSYIFGYSQFKNVVTK